MTACCISCACLCLLVLILVSASLCGGISMFGGSLCCIQWPLLFAHARLGTALLCRVGSLILHFRVELCISSSLLRLLDFTDRQFASRPSRIL